MTARAAAFAVALGLSVIAACSPSPAPPSDPDVTPSPSAGGSSGQAGAGGSADAGSASITRIHRGRRGLGCSVKNDCVAGLSCIQGVCQPSSFGISPTGKECVQIDCRVPADCCAGRTTEVPEACRGRATTCLPQLPGCVPKECSRTAECAGGGVCVGRCAVSSGECRGNVDCLANKCLEGRCSLNFTACQSDAECAPNTCAGGSCACDNPSYLPEHPVCKDPACEGLCLWTCEDSRCVLPSDCTTSDDCVGAAPHCVEGACVECTVGTDCSFGKICLDGRCETACREDAQCGLFEACQGGECIYVGCRSDRECALVPDVRSLGLQPGVDSRLLRCHTEQGAGRCLIPCQTDSQCGPTEVCSGGRCQYIGCETNDECVTILSVHEQGTSDERPWVPAVECRAAP